MTTTPEQAAPSMTTTAGTTVTLQPSDDGLLVILDNPDAPEDMRNYEAGRVVDGALQPAAFSLAALSPGALRAIAELIEDAEGVKRERETLELELLIRDTNDGEAVPVDVTLAYPNGKGLAAAVALTRNPPSLFRTIASELLYRGDESTLSAAAKVKEEAAAEAETEAADTEKQEG